MAMQQQARRVLERRLAPWYSLTPDFMARD